MALTNPTTQADNEFSASLKVTDPLKYAILKQSFEYAGDVVNNQMEAKHDVCKLKREKGKQAADSVNQQLSVTLKRAMDLAQERGTSTWLTIQPTQKFGFTLHKSVFQDALALHYNWQLPVSVYRIVTLNNHNASLIRILFWFTFYLHVSHGSPPLVFVVPSFQLNMPCPVPKVASPRFNIMKYET